MRAVLVRHHRRGGHAHRRRAHRAPPGRQGRGPGRLPVLAGTGAADGGRGRPHQGRGAAPARTPCSPSRPRPRSDATAATRPDSASLTATTGQSARRQAASRCSPTTSPGCRPPACRSRPCAGLPIAGIKDSSGSADRLLDELAHYAGAVYVGSSALLALAGPMGGAGAILALANVEPERCCRAFAGDAAAQRELAEAHLAVRAGGPAVSSQCWPRSGYGDQPGLLSAWRCRLTASSAGQLACLKRGIAVPPFREIRWSRRARGRGRAGRIRRLLPVGSHRVLQHRRGPADLDPWLVLAVVAARTTGSRSAR